MKKTLFLLCGLFALEAKAVLIGVSGSTGDVSFQEHQYLAQEFAFTGTADIDSFNLYFGSSIGNPFGATLTISQGLGAGATSLFSTAFTADDGTVNVPASVSLTAGAYFFVLSTTEDVSLHSTRSLTGSTLTETFGAVGSSFFSISQNVANPEQSPFAEFSDSLMFEISGNFTGIHDPVAARALLGSSGSGPSVPDSSSSGCLFAIAASCIAALKARRN